MLRRFLSTRYGFGILTATLFGVLFFTAYAAARRTGPNDKIAKPNEVQITGGIEQTGQRGPEAELVTVTPAGFEPLNIRRPRGPFILVFDDRSGIDGLAYRIDRLSGGTAHNLKRSKKKMESYDVLDLPPGDYRLTASPDRTWECRITIEP